jgi:hypothetical protein
MSNRPLSTLDLINRELQKCEKIVVANKPDSVGEKEIVKYMREFREWTAQDFFLYYKRNFWEVNLARKRENPEYKCMDPVFFTWDMIDQMWPFVKQVKGDGGQELEKCFKMITALFDTILK